MSGQRISGQTKIMSQRDEIVSRSPLIKVSPGAPETHFLVDSEVRVGTPQNERKPLQKPTFWPRPPGPPRTAQDPTFWPSRTSPRTTPEYLEKSPESGHFLASWPPRNSRKPLQNPTFSPPGRPRPPSRTTPRTARNSRKVTHFRPLFEFLATPGPPRTAQDHPPGPLAPYHRPGPDFSTSWDVPGPPPQDL